MSREAQTAELAEALPYLRRYARALTGNQTSGDTYAAATLEAILADEVDLPDGLDGRLALFRAFHKIWVSSGAPINSKENGLRARAQKHLGRLTTNTREALLLHSVEDFVISDVATIMESTAEETQGLIDIARREMQDASSGSVLIIEDEAVIALDLQDIVAEIGHRVVGVARTRDQAVTMGRETAPNLILADIQLADNSSGIDAVNDLLETMPDTPVIFITAFPERLLTGDKPEPAFLISKPYTEEQVRSAASQAMFFASTETLHQST